MEKKRFVLLGVGDNPDEECFKAGSRSAEFYFLKLIEDVLDFHRTYFKQIGCVAGGYEFMLYGSQEEFPQDLRNFPRRWIFWFSKKLYFQIPQVCP